METAVSTRPTLPTSDNIKKMVPKSRVFMFLLSPALAQPGERKAVPTEESVGSNCDSPRPSLRERKARGIPEGTWWSDMPQVPGQSHCCGLLHRPVPNPIKSLALSTHCLKLASHLHVHSVSPHHHQISTDPVQRSFLFFAPPKINSNNWL